ncbi:ClpP/crotonase-like domain-containing protein [Lipomyces tetrasporus]|uniref:ClpP/crotonase-like domain-containing protein n=1 Tax=Lipomyces tetrasporus TaxID=54092 RepID=A0AAD7QNS5_9ASCO|nr:ClpP/crotonase-like domain-containing protein [Lipomyces tetrasporus]KAJ8098626.1 ClpP/crotonase-like domain-containing protein [Lipomyces tetrasporus]
MQLPIVFPVHNAASKGNIILSKADSGRYYLLTINSPPDNRLTPEMCVTLAHALDVLEDSFLSGEKLPLVTTSSIQKFYSNGLDLELARSTPGFWDNALYPLFKRFLQYPTPCIAMINGHAFAGGFMLSMCHDYRIMNPSRGFLCLNELEFGAPLTSPMSAIFRFKLTPAAYQKCVLEATRFTADTAIAHNLVDAKGSLADVDEFIKARNIGMFAESPAYGQLKSEMWREIINYCDTPFAEEEARIESNIHREGERKKARAQIRAKM